MRITDNMVTASLVNQIQQLDSQQSSLQSEVSSGLSVTQPSDNPAVYGQVIELEGQNSQDAQYAANASQALSVVQSSYSGLSTLQQIYDRATELGALAGNGTNNTGDVQSYATELNQLIQQAVGVANSQYNGSYLYAGTAVTTQPFTTTTDGSGNIASVTYVGNSGQSMIPLSQTSNVSATTSGTTNQGIATMITNMIALSTAMQSGDASAVNTAASNLEPSDNVLTAAVAENGAVEARIQSDQTQLQSMSTQISTEISNDTSADLPSTIVKLNQTQLAYQAALETASKVMQLSLVDYIQ
jgi:flagellar hook-associated protein 3 FlgL